MYRSCITILFIACELDVSQCEFSDFLHIAMSETVQNKTRVTIVH